MLSKLQDTYFFAMLFANFLEWTYNNYCSYFRIIGIKLYQDICTVYKFVQGHRKILAWESMGHRSTQEETLADTRSPVTYETVAGILICPGGYLTNITIGTKWVRIFCQWIAVTFWWKAFTHHTPRSKCKLIILWKFIYDLLDKLSLPGVFWACWDLVLFITITSWIINWTSCFGQIIRRVGHTNLCH